MLLLLLQVFTDMLDSSQQGFLDSEKGMEARATPCMCCCPWFHVLTMYWQDVLVYIPDEGVKSKLRGYWDSKKSGQDKWTQLTREVASRHPHERGLDWLCPAR